MNIEIEIAGRSPLLINQFSDTAALVATTGTRSAHVGGQPGPREDAESRLYTNSEGHPIIPVPNLLRCIVDAGKFFKAGRTKVTTQKSSLLSACVDIEGIELLITHRHPWSVDSRPVRIPATGGRVIRHRPRFDDWRITFRVALDTTIISKALFRDIVDAAGRQIGLGDFRPDCKGPFGKFEVVRWEEDKGVDNERSKN